jgi:hypothetical protein
MVRVREARRAYRRLHTECFLVLRSRVSSRACRRRVGRASPHETRLARGLAARVEAVPLTEFQNALATCLSANRSLDSYLPGGAAILIEPGPYVPDLAPRSRR